MYETNPYFYGTGRRKKSVARVRVYAGSGKITINNRDPRMKERKKYGLKGARRAPQFSKR